MFAAVLTAILLAQAASPVHDGSHDFDFEIGTWTIAVHREVHPLSGSHVWTDPAGYHHLVRKVWGGQASLAELELDKPAPHFLGLMLRLYDTKSGRWSVYWASSEGSTIDAPLVGQFAHGRGVFVGHDTYNGRPVEVRVVYSDITPHSFRTEQWFSTNGGASWEPVLIQTFSRVSS